MIRVRVKGHPCGISCPNGCALPHLYQDGDMGWVVRDLHESPPEEFSCYYCKAVWPWKEWEHKEHFLEVLLDKDYAEDGDWDWEDTCGVLSEHEIERLEEDANVE